MPKAKKYNTKALYISDKVKNEMSRLLDFPCTVVEAPMGYGKTTAVKEALRNIDAKVLWQSIYEGSISDFWIGFCNIISSIGKELAGRLRKIGLPTDTVLRHEVVSLIQAAELPAQTILVIDDYHFIRAAEVDEFMAFLLRNIPAKLHIIVITRLAFLSDTVELRLKGIINHIGADVLKFDPDEISKYYKLCGISITEEEQNTLYCQTEGWISALYLFMLEYTVCGRFTLTRDISMLVYRTVFLPLSDELKDFLICVCIFETFGLKQAQYVWGKNNTEDLLNSLLSYNAFIVQDHLSGNYRFHRIFNSCLREELSKKPDDKQNSIWRKAGFWYINNAEYITAMDCFFHIGDFEELLCALEKDKGNSFTAETKGKLISYLSACPENIRAHHHFALLAYSRKLFTFNEMEMFKNNCAEFIHNIASDTNLSIIERNNLSGEYELLLGFVKYNDILKMSEHHQKAYNLMTTVSKIFDTSVNWTFGSPSVLYMFYRESGKLSEQVEVMKKAMPCYYQITGGHGTGAEIVMEAEVLFYRGNIENAEVACHKAIYKLNNSVQSGLLICAAFLQIKIAILNGDFNMASNLLRQARDIVISQKQYLYIYTMDLCEAYIYTMLNQPNMAADWIINCDINNTRMAFPAIPFVHMVYAGILLEKGENLKLISLSEMFLQAASVYPNLICHIYLFIYLSAAYKNTNHPKQAYDNLLKAFNIAMPDKIYMPFAENGAVVFSIINSENKFNEYTDEIQKIFKLYKKFEASVKSIKNSYFAADKYGLTSRESEVAILVAKGFSNKDIANQLYISENTVKLRLKNIFQKMSIHSRSDLRKFYN